MESRHRINRVTVCVTMLISFVLLFGSTVLARDGADKFLILHVDGFFRKTSLQNWRKEGFPILPVCSKGGKRSGMASHSILEELRSL